MLPQSEQAVDGNTVCFPPPYVVFSFGATTNIPIDSCKDTEPALVYRYFLAARASEKTCHREAENVCLPDYLSKFEDSN